MEYAIITKIIKETFENNEKVTLSMLYKSILELDNDEYTATIKHTVRSIVHSMKKQNKIESIAPSTYKKV